MDHRHLARGVTGYALLASVGALALTRLTMARYRPPADGGTSLTGVYFGLVLLVAGAALVQSLAAGVTVALDPPSGLGLWILLGGVGTAALAATLAALTTLPTLLGQASAVGAAIDRIYGPIFLSMLVLAPVAPAATILGGVAASYRARRSGRAAD